MLATLVVNGKAYGVHKYVFCSRVAGSLRSEGFNAKAVAV